MPIFEELLQRLNQSPTDWSIRIQAIEEAVRSSDMEEARRLVREDPSGLPTPPEIQVRLHALLTKGAEALSPREEPSPLSGGEEGNVEENPPKEEFPSDAHEGDASLHTEQEQEQEISVSEEGAARPEFTQEYEGGLGALVERDHTPVEAMAAPIKRPAAPEIKWEETLDRWRNYEGDLNLVEGDFLLPVERDSHAPEKVSSVAFAMMLHLIVFVLIGLVVIQVPMPKPPQLIVSVMPDRQSELVTPRLTRPTPEIKPAAAAASAIDVISSIGDSNFSLPEVDDSESFNVQSMIAGIQPIGNGMSFSAEATKASDVNFFGISGGGRKIVFIIDATPLMLVDEKGGMTAYDKVKEEVGIMLASLNRGTHFNILLYQGKRVVSFRDKMVPGLPSNLRLAIEWMHPLNRTYERLGLPREYGETLAVSDYEDIPIQAADLAHYTKAIQKAMEWQASTIFCIASGYGRMNRTPTPEMLKKMAENPPTPGTPGTFDPGEQKAWREAVARTRDWLNKENAARKEKGISPKVVVNFNQLVRDRTGATPPRRRGGTPGSGNTPSLPPIGPDDIERQLEKLVKLEYKKEGHDEPSVHMVLFLGEEERIGDDEDHFRTLTRRNRGKLKILRGLAALDDVTGN